MSQKSGDSLSNLSPWSTDLAAQDAHPDWQYDDGQHAVDEENARNCHQADVPEPECKEYLFVDDVLWQNAEAVDGLLFAAGADHLEVATDPVEIFGN